MMVHLPLGSAAVKMMLMKRMAGELIFRAGFSRGANGRTGLQPQDLGPYKSGGWQRPAPRGGRRLAEGGGCGAARADGVRSGTV